MTVLSKWKPAAVLAALAAGLVAAGWASAAVIGPYTADSNTSHLYHFNETDDNDDVDVVPTFADTGTGATVDLGNNRGTDGAAAFSGFDTAFDVESGGVSASPGNFGRAATSATAGPQNDWQGTGALTYELLLSTSSIADNQILLSRDGDTDERGWLLQILDVGELQFFSGAVAVTTPIPTTGDHKFVVDEWFHVAFTYDGDDVGTDNAQFYWTRVDDQFTTANLIGTVTLTADAIAFDNGTTLNLFGVGAQTRTLWKDQLLGKVDEVRISSVVRGADEFIFAIPEPSTFALATLGLLSLGLVGWRWRKR